MEIVKLNKESEQQQIKIHPTPSTQVALQRLSC